MLRPWKNSPYNSLLQLNGQESASAQVAELEEALREAEHQMRRSELLGREAIRYGTAVFFLGKLKGKPGQTGWFFQEVDRMIGRFNFS